MRVVFRADASLDIGNGHVMRCLTLAQVLASRGAECFFLCRTHAGNLIDFVREQGFGVHALTFDPTPAASDEDSRLRDNCVAGLQAQDAQACELFLSTLQPDWLIVDHYELDAKWELALTHVYGKLLVIDDLANRSHIANVLLDQNLGRDPQDYRGFVNHDCILLCGPRYALLRREFAALRLASLRRRKTRGLRQLLISMGGVDRDNVTGRVLEALMECSLPSNCEVVVVMGRHSPHAADVQAKAEVLPWRTCVLKDVGDMAQIMADSDLAIGAAGSSTWERCCLGLPALMVVLAENQRELAKAVTLAGAAKVVDPSDLCGLDWSKALEMGPRAATLADGRGAERVVGSLIAPEA